MHTDLRAELEAAMLWIRKEVEDFYNEELVGISERPEDYEYCDKNDFITFWIER